MARHWLTTVGLGAAAGLIAGFAMEQAQTALSKLKSDTGQDDSSTVKAADRVSLALAHQAVPRPYREEAGRVVHYTTAAALGVVYAVCSGKWRGLRRGFGSAFGLATALILDEVAVPVLHLGPSPTETPPAEHLYGLAAHLVFGTTLETARCLLMRSD